MSEEAARRAAVEGRDILVCDGLVTPGDARQYFVALSQAAFTRSETASPERAEYRHWVCEMPLGNLPRVSLWPATQRAVALLRGEERYEPYRVYTNYAGFGDMLFTHVDALPNARELTALWFLSESWDIEWGGETLFFDSSGDAQVVSPKPGRLVLFDGAIRHVGRAPNRICTTPRYTFAIKLRLSAR